MNELLLEVHPNWARYEARIKHAYIFTNEPLSSISNWSGIPWQTIWYHVTSRGWKRPSLKQNIYNKIKILKTKRVTEPHKTKVKIEQPVYDRLADTRRNAPTEPVFKMMMEYIPSDTIKNGTILDPVMAGGQSIRAVNAKLRENGISENKRNKRIHGWEDNRYRTAYVQVYNKIPGNEDAEKTLGKFNYKRYNDILRTTPKMKYDLVIGNPPFNVATPVKSAIPGKGSGNTKLFMKFIDKFFELSDQTVAMVVPPRGIRYAAEHYHVNVYSWDTPAKWTHSAGFFISNKNDKSIKNVTQDPIVRKLYMMDEQWNAFSYGTSGNYEKLLANGVISKKRVPGATYGIVNLPNANSDNIEYGWITGKTQTGVRLIFKGLESRVSYTPTKDPSCLGSSASIWFDSMAEARAAKKFILNNPIVKHIKEKTREQTLGFAFRYIKRFDLSQIKTGYEIPKEWNLTKEDLKLLGIK